MMWKPSACSKLSTRGLPNWDGPMAATFGSITVGQAVTSARSELLQRSWSSYRPTSWSAMQLPRWRHCNRRPAPSPSCSYRLPTRLAKALSRAGTSGRQYNGLRRIRGLAGHQVDGRAQTDSARPQEGYHHLQPKDGAVLLTVLGRD